MKVLRKPTTCQTQEYHKILFTEFYHIPVLIFVICPDAETISVVFVVVGSEMSFVDELVVFGKTVDSFKAVN